MFRLRFVVRYRALAVLVPVVFSFMMVFSSVPPAQAQRFAIKSEFRLALQPYGEFREHSRWGEVWVPSRVNREWRPYTVGHWVYSDDYGWYWDADQEEQEWGWVAYHYGRWVWDADLGWCWVAGDEWSPAWVQWRRGEQLVGWSPLPPDEIIVEVRESPRYWMFVEPQEIFATNLLAVYVNPAPVRFGETVVVNRTVLIQNQGFAVNPGIAPGFFAAAIGRPIRTYDVRPRIFAGTAAIPRAIEMRADAQGRNDFRQQLRENNVRQSANLIGPARNIERPRAIGPRDAGVLGETPPRLATRQGGPPRDQRGGPPGRQGTIGAAPDRQEQGGRGDRERNAPGRNVQERGNSVGVAPEGRDQGGRNAPRTRERDLQDRSKQTATPPPQPSQRQDQRGAQDRPGTSGVAPRDREQGGREFQGRGDATPATPREEQRGRPDRNGPPVTTGIAPRDQQQRGGREQFQRGTPDRGTIDAAPPPRREQSPPSPQQQQIQRGTQERGTVGAAPPPRREQSPPSPQQQQIQRGTEERGTVGAVPPPRREQSPPSPQQQQIQRGTQERGTVGAGPPRAEQTQRAPSPQPQMQQPQMQRGSSPQQQQSGPRERQKGPN